MIGLHHIIPEDSFEQSKNFQPRAFQTQWVYHNTDFNVDTVTVREVRIFQVVDASHQWVIQYCDIHQGGLLIEYYFYGQLLYINDNSDD